MYCSKHYIIMLLRPIYTEELPGVVAHDCLFCCVG